MKKHLIIIVVLTAIFSCKSDKKDGRTTPTKVKIIQEWFANSNFAGELMAMYKTDSIQGIDIELTEGSYDIDPIKMVLSNTFNIGVAGADKVLVANDKGANLVVIGVVNKFSPTCFLSLKKNNITKPKDFEGKKIGILTGTATEYVYRTLVAQQNLDKSKLDELEVSFDLNTFLNGSFDVRPAFVYDEPVSLELQKVAYNIIEPKDYGVEFLGTVYFCKKEYIDKNPKLVQKIVNALASGWENAIKDPTTAMNMLKKFAKDANIKRETISFNKGLPYFEGENKKVLTADVNRWKKMAESLIKLKVIKSFDDKSVNNSFITNYHK